MESKFSSQSLWKYLWILTTVVLLIYIPWDMQQSQHSIFKKELISSNVSGKHKLTLTQMRSDKFSLFPLSVNVSSLVEELKSNITPSIPALYDYNNYKYMSECKHICESDFKVLFVVKTGCGNFERRKTVRETWGKVSADHRIVFVLGNDQKFNSEIFEESKIHQDIVQFDFEDNYFNLTLKDMLAFKWVLEYCSKIEYIALVDDDIIVTVDNVVKYYETIPRVKQGKFYGGEINFVNIPFRTELYKNRISYEEYAWDRFPNYVIGVCSFFTADIIRDMYYASFYTKHIRIDDVYLGLLAKKLNVEPVHMGYDVIYAFGSGNGDNVLCENSQFENRFSLDFISK